MSNLTSENPTVRLTAEQENAVRLTELPTLVTAAAGSGKTSVLVARYLALLDAGLKPNEILCVTFTTDAAMELQERILAQLKNRETAAELQLAVQRSRFIGTIHSFCFFVLNEYGSLIRKTAINKILGSYELELAIESYYYRWLNSLTNESLQLHLGNFGRLELRSLFESLYYDKEKLRACHTAQNLVTPLSLFFQSVLPYYDQLDENFQKEGSYRFQDLEFLSHQILRDCPVARLRLQAQFKALLIDEFQDTSRGQWELLKSLVGSEPKKLFLVGDPKQSIYSFRNADVSLFNELQSEFSTLEGNVCALNTNFRTEPDLLNQINEWSTRLFVEGPISFQPMQSGRSPGNGTWSTLFYEEPSQTPELDPRTTPEVAVAVSKVQELIKHGVARHEIALLFRMNDHLDHYARALQNKGIATQASQTVSLFKCYDILDILNFLQAVQNPRDDFFLGAFLLSPYVQFNLADLLGLREGAEREETKEKQKKGIFNHLLEANEPSLRWFFSLTETPNLSFRQAMSSLFRNTKYFPTEKEAFLELLTPLTEKALSVGEAISAMEVWKRQGLDFRQESFQPSGDAVNLMTVHGAKGLEFPHVLLVDTLRRSPSRNPTVLFPLKEGENIGLKYTAEGRAVTTDNYDSLKHERDQLNQEEAKRILYVALTRAKQSLTVILPKEASRIPKGSWAEFFLRS